MKKFKLKKYKDKPKKILSLTDGGGNYGYNKSTKAAVNSRIFSRTDLNKIKNNFVYIVPKRTGIISQILYIWLSFN